MEKRQLIETKEMFDNCCKFLTDEMEWHYETDASGEVYRISLKVGGDDLPVSIDIRFYPEQSRMMVLSQLPFSFPKEKINEGAMASCMINQSLAEGCFDYNIENGSIVFRITQNYENCPISNEVFRHLIMILVFTTDKYNDKLFGIAKGMLTLPALAKVIEGE